MKLTAILFIIGWSLQATAQTLIPFDSRQWTIEAEQSSVEDFQGKKALFLKRNGLRQRSAATGRYHRI